MNGGVPGTRSPEDWAALDRALGDLAASGCVEVREDGQWLAELATLQCEGAGAAVVGRAQSDAARAVREGMRRRPHRPGSAKVRTHEAEPAGILAHGFTSRRRQDYARTISRSLRTHPQGTLS